MSDSFDPTIRKPLARAGEFELLRRMGAGGFGVVFEARHLRSGLPYALKRIDMSAEDAERYRNEALYPARIAAESLHVMGVHSFFHDGDNDVFYLVTDLVPHGDLRRFLDRERKPLPVAQGLELGIGIAKGLAAIHAQGIIHRDLKPANVLMDRKDGVWVPKITDFGLARSSRSVSLGDFATSGYASPEQIDLLSDHPLGPESDLFAFGMMLYEVVTGAKPTPAQELREYGRWLGKRQPPPPPSHVRPELTQWPQLDAILASLLEFDRSRREGSAAVVLRRLIDVREMVAGGPKVDRVPGAPSLPEPVAVRLPAPPPIPPPAPALAPPPAPAARRPVDVPRGGGHPASDALPQVLVATTAFVSLFAMVGVASTIWPIYSVLMRENGWTFEQFTAATPYLVLLAFPLFTIIAGVTSDRFGPRPLMAVGLLFVCLAPLARAAGS
jgi:serine/threonine protein kinase